jgi:hypothetical protein
VTENPERYKVPAGATLDAKKLAVLSGKRKGKMGCAAMHGCMHGCSQHSRASNLESKVVIMAAWK